MTWTTLARKLSSQFYHGRPPAITNKQIMSHYFGFGSLQLDNLKSPQSRLTGQDPSGKFQQRLMLKQKEIEVRT
jgi:hypothetical protein